MANKLELIENYVVFSDTATGDNLGEYAVNHCVYTEETDRFEIKEVIDNGRLTITKADLLAEKWVDGSLVVYTEETMRDFLRANTGFKPAPGGSGALPYKLFSGYIVDNGAGNVPTITQFYSNFSTAINGGASLTNGEIQLTNGGSEFGANTSILVEIRAEGINPLNNWTSTAERIDDRTIIIRLFDNNGTQQQFSRFNIEIKVFE